MATGSGKTLLMHANILQYQHYLEKHGRARELNRIILLTPNEGSRSSTCASSRRPASTAELFNKDGRGLFAGQAVEIIEITSYARRWARRPSPSTRSRATTWCWWTRATAAPAAGEEGAWMRFRNALCEKGFSFEYSATFGQAVKGNAEPHRPLRQEHPVRLLVPLLLRRRLRQGLPDPQPRRGHAGQPSRALSGRLPAAVLPAAAAVPRAARPPSARSTSRSRCGSSSAAASPRRWPRSDASDIVEILLFLARYVADRAGSIERIERVLNQGLVTADWQEPVRRPLHLPEHLRAHAGAGLRRDAGDALQRAGRRRPARREPEGRHRRGGAARRATTSLRRHQRRRRRQAVKLCEENGLATSASASSPARSSTRSIRPHSTVNVLIGSKKFTEGWSSWRVSTMGLMNVGRGRRAHRSSSSSAVACGSRATT